MSFSPSGNNQNEPSVSRPEDKDNVGQSKLKRTQSEDFVDTATKRGRIELEEAEVIPTNRHQLSFSATSIIEFPPICSFDPSMPPIDGTSPFSELPDEMVQHIFCYIGVALSSIDFPKSVGFKFSLATVCKQFKRLINHKSSWEWDHINLCIDSPIETQNQNGCQINSKPFTLALNGRPELEKYSAALKSLLKVAPINSILYHYRQSEDSNANIGKHIVEQLEHNRVILDKTVKKIEIGHPCVDDPTDQVRFLSLFTKVEQLKIQYEFDATTNRKLHLQSLQYIGQYTNLRKLAITCIEKLPFQLQSLAKALAKKPLHELEIDATFGPRKPMSDLANLCNAVHGPLKKIVFKNYFHGDIFDFVNPCQAKLSHLHYLHLTPLDYIPHTLQNCLQLLPALTYLKMEIRLDLDYVDNWEQIIHNSQQIAIRGILTGGQPPKKRRRNYVQNDNRIQTTKDNFYHFWQFEWNNPNVPVPVIFVDRNAWMTAKISEYLDHMAHLLGQNDAEFEVADE